MQSSKEAFQLATQTDDGSNKNVVYVRSLGELVRVATQAFIPLQVVYTPEDIKGVNNERDEPDHWCYPFTKGIYPRM